MCCGCFSLESDNPAQLKKKLKNICKCAVGWIIFGILSLGTGIVLLVFFAEYLNQDTWKKGVGYCGLAFLLLGIIILGVGILIAVVLRKIVQRQESRGKFSPAAVSSGAKYPHQEQAPAVAPPSGQPSAPPATNDQSNKQKLDVIEPETRDKTF